MDAHELKAKFPREWDYACKHGCSIDKAREALEIEENLKALTPTQNQTQYNEELEQSDEFVEVDPETVVVINDAINAILDNSITREEQLKRVAELAKSYTKETEIIMKLASKYLEFLKLQKEEAERQSGEYHVAIQAFNEATSKFLELAKQAQDTVDKYNELNRKFREDYDNKIHDLNMRLGH